MKDIKAIMMILLAIMMIFNIATAMIGCSSGGGGGGGGSHDPGPVPTATATATPSPSPSPTATATASPRPSPSPTATASPTPSPSPTATATATPSPSPSPTASPAPSPSPTHIPPPSVRYEKDWEILIENNPRHLIATGDLIYIPVGNTIEVYNRRGEHVETKNINKGTMAVSKDANGNFLLTHSGKLHIYDSIWNHIKEHPIPLGSVNNHDCLGNVLYILYSGYQITDVIKVDTTNGNVLQILELFKINPGNIYEYPQGIAVNQDGSFWVTYRISRKVILYNANGVQIHELISPESMIGPSGISINYRGYIAVSMVEKIQFFDQDYRFIGKTDNEMRGYYGVTFLPFSDDVVATDDAGKKIIRYNRQ